MSIGSVLGLLAVGLVLWAAAIRNRDAFWAVMGLLVLGVVELDLFEIPRDALAPYGAYTGGGMVDESGEPLLEPADPTAYRVKDVDPARAVAIIHGGRVRIARVNDGADSVPAALCRFLRDDGRDYLDGQDKEGGLARFGC